MQLVEHESLDAARKGFEDKIKKAGLNIDIDYQNANGDQGNTNTIADRFANEKMDLILTIATPAAQAMVNKEKNVPVLFTAVTDPGKSGLTGSSSTNVTGTSDKTPIDKQLQLLLDLKPSIKTVGLLYSSAEENSLIQIKEAKDYLDKKGVSYIDMTVVNSNDIQSVLENKIDKIDGIYTPTDNAVATAMPTVQKIATPKKVPVVAGAVDMVKAGGTATIGLEYYKLGEQTADMAVSILKGEKKVADIPVEFAKENITEFNDANMKDLGIDIPEKYKK